MSHRHSSCGPSIHRSRSVGPHRQNRACRVLARAFEAPPRGHHEPHATLPERLKGSPGPGRDLHIPSQDGPVEVEGTYLEGHSGLCSAVPGAQRQLVKDHGAEEIRTSTPPSYEASIPHMFATLNFSFRLISQR